MIAPTTLLLVSLSFIKWPRRQRLAGGDPAGRDPLDSGVARHNPAGDRAGRVDIAQPAGRLPARLGKVVQVPRGAPDRERYRVLGRDISAISKRCRGRFD